MASIPHFNDTVNSTTTTSATGTRTTTTPIKRTRPSFDIGYVRTLGGILKLVELLLDFITFICLIAGSDPRASDVGWAEFVSITAFIVTLILFALYLFHIVDLVPGLPWLLLEFVYCIIWVLFFIIASSLMASKAATYDDCAAYGAAAFFGFLVMTVYGFDGAMKFIGWRKGPLA